jgi:Zn-dependent M28 family amino/carboxypeptidase
VDIATRLRQLKLRHGVGVLLFDLEEAGLVGSRHFAAHVAQQGRAPGVAAMVNLDIVNRPGAVIFGPAGEPGNAALYGTMWQVCAAQRLTCVQMTTYPPGDDHSFQAAGIPNISLAVVAPAEAHQLWLLLNGGKDSGLAPGFIPDTLRTIHTREDTPERLEPQALALAHQAMLQLLLQLDRDLP